MAPDAYQSAIEHAVKKGDRETIAAVGMRLAESTEAMVILRAKGYGTTGMGLAALVKLVPMAKLSEG